METKHDTNTGIGAELLPKPRKLRFRKGDKKRWPLVIHPTLREREVQIRRIRRQQRALRKELRQTRAVEAPRQVWINARLTRLAEIVQRIVANVPRSVFQRA
jgi:hypothetical protein